MVKLEEVPEKHDVDLFDDDSDNYTDDDDVSDDDDFDDADESFFERIYALKDIIPLKRRQAISGTVLKAYGWGQVGFRFFSKSAWVLTTSMLLLVLPLALEIEKEQALVAYENEMKLQQQGTQQLAGSNIYGQPQQGQGQKNVVPPGF